MPLGCTPPTDEYPEDASAPSGITGDNITTEDRGPCDCCKGEPPCSIADDLEAGEVDLCMNIEGEGVPCSVGAYTLPWIGGKEWGYVQVPWEDDEANCITGEAAFAYGLNCVNIVGEDQWSISVGGSFTDCTFTLIDWSASPFMLKFLAKRSCLVDIPAGGSDTFTITFTAISPDCPCPPDPDEPLCLPPPPPPPLWWCVETPTYPFRDCVQGVTEAVEGGYATEEECRGDADCLPCNFYCVRYQDHDADHNPVGQPYFACVALTGVTVGQVDDDLAGGIAHHRTRTVLDGPFTAARCVCPACGSAGRVAAEVACDEPVAPGGGMMVAMRAAAAPAATPKAAPKSPPAKACLPLVEECVWQGDMVERCKTCGSDRRHVYRCLHPGQDPARGPGRCTRGDPDRADGAWQCNRCPDYRPHPD